MRKSTLLVLLVATAGLGATSRHLGGWAVVTVDDLPDYVVAGRPVRLSFVVRQHGMQRLDGLRPRIDATSGSASLSVNAQPSSATSADRSLDTATGRYVATLNLSKPGEWTVTIHSGFGAQTTTLPLRAVERGAAPPRALSDVERGRRLFIAKGCFNCHVNTEVTTAASGRIGPELTGRRYPPAALANFLAHPDSVQLTQLPRTGPFRMPNLGLKEREIASLVAMINGGRQLSAR
jgi:mono/diheme cytochrome c family protein